MAEWPQGAVMVDVSALIKRARLVNAAPVQGEQPNRDEAWRVLDETVRYINGLPPDKQEQAAKRLNEEYQQPPKYVSGVPLKGRDRAPGENKA